MNPPRGRDEGDACPPLTRSSPRSRSTRAGGVVPVLARGRIAERAAAVLSAAGSARRPGGSRRGSLRAAAGAPRRAVARAGRRDPAPPRRPRGGVSPRDLPRLRPRLRLRARLLAPAGSARVRRAPPALLRAHDGEPRARRDGGARGALSPRVGAHGRLGLLPRRDRRRRRRRSGAPRGSISSRRTPARPACSPRSRCSMRRPARSRSGGSSRLPRRRSCSCSRSWGSG